MRNLDAREYKLLLNPQTIRSKPDLTAANVFWDERIRRIVQLVDPHASPFKLAAHRNIRFWDTANCDLTKHDLILRTRQDADAEFAPNADPEATLKLRMPDQFTVGTTSFSNATADVETKFEEDIGPLEFVATLPGEGERLVAPKKLSTRNRFSLSTTVPLSSSAQLRDLGQVYDYFPGARRLLAAPGDLELVGGPIIHEYTFRRSAISLDGSDNEAKFTLSIWCFDNPSNPPDVVEVSFLCKTDHGQIAGKTARRAYNLFINLQEVLSDILETSKASKTAISLPCNCGG